MEQHPAESWGHFLTPLFSEAPPRTPGALSTCWPGPEAPLAPHPSFAAAAPPPSARKHEDSKSCSPELCPSHVGAPQARQPFLKRHSPEQEDS